MTILFFFKQKAVLYGTVFCLFSIGLVNCSIKTDKQTIIISHKSIKLWYSPVDSIMDGVTYKIDKKNILHRKDFTPKLVFEKPPNAIILPSSNYIADKIGQKVFWINCSSYQMTIYLAKQILQDTTYQLTDTAKLLNSGQLIIKRKDNKEITVELPQPSNPFLIIEAAQ